jgi:hypothetical protein
MRITGLISLRGAGRFLDINTLEEDKINYVLQNYARYTSYNDPDKYFQYVSTLDKNLFKLKTVKISSSKAEKLLSQLAKIYLWKNISDELSILARKGTSKDSILKFIPAPTRLEFLTALSIKCKFGNKIRVVPNYSCDDTGLPTSTASGNQGDIECFEQGCGVLVEVTMAVGRTQTMMEVWPIERHLGNFNKKFNFNNSQGEAIFTAPSIFSDSNNQIMWVKDKFNLKIRPYSILEFIDYLNRHTHLKEKKLYNVEDDANVKSLIINQLGVTPKAKILSIQALVQRNFGEQYCDMSNSDWFNIINSFLLLRLNSSDTIMIDNEKKVAEDISNERK